MARPRQRKPSRRQTKAPAEKKRADQNSRRAPIVTRTCVRAVSDEETRTSAGSRVSRQAMYFDPCAWEQRV